MARQLIKSIHVAVAAVVTAGTALAASAIWLGTPDELLSSAYGSQLTREAVTRQVQATGINGPGSEQFWLTKDAGAGRDGALRTLALGDRFTMPELTPVASGTAAAATTLEVIDVEEIAHAGRGGRMLLITAKAVGAAGIEQDDNRPLVRFVIDLEAAAAPATKAARSL